MTPIRTRWRQRRRHGAAESMALAIELWLRGLGGEEPAQARRAEAGAGSSDRWVPDR
jgi:hypothetical protein